MNPIYLSFCSPVLDDRQRLQEFTIRCPDNFNFAYDVVDVIAEREPNKVALVWCNPQGEERIITFREMRDLSNQCAAFLSRQGIQRGDRVMLILKRHYEYWYVLLALHRLGAVAIPSTFLLTAEDIEYRVRSAKIRAVVCADDTAVMEHVRKAQKECPDLQYLFNVRKYSSGFVRIDTGIQGESERFARVDTRSTDPFLLYFTSGTTGHPKAVVHDYSYPLAHIVTAKYWQNVVDGGLHLTVADTGWGKASWGKIYGQWLAGSGVMAYDFERFDPDEMMAVINKYRVTTFCAPPTVFRLLVKNGLSRYDFSALKYVTTAGEALNADIIRQFEETTGLSIHEGYGQTETTLLIGNLAGQPYKRGCMGKPSPLYHLAIVDGEGQDVPPGTVGEIVIKPRGERQFGICIGYDQNEEAFERTWRQGVYHTGDMAYADEDGYYWFVSRADDIIKSSGYRIGPFEVESALIQHPAVQECAVIGVPDEERGAVVKASVVLQPGYVGSTALISELQTFVKSVTAPYKYPRIIEFVEELPKTISGKIMRYVLRKPLAGS